jgi:hypothetical protein
MVKSMTHFRVVFTILALFTLLTFAEGGSLINYDDEIIRIPETENVGFANEFDPMNDEIDPEGTARAERTERSYRKEETGFSVLPPKLSAPEVLRHAQEEALEAMNSPKGSQDDTTGLSQLRSKRSAPEVLRHAQEELLEEMNSPKATNPKEKSAPAKKHQQSKKANTPKQLLAKAKTKAARLEKKLQLDKAKTKAATEMKKLQKTANTKAAKKVKTLQKTAKIKAAKKKKLQKSTKKKADSEKKVPKPPVRSRHSKKYRTLSRG